MMEEIEMLKEMKRNDGTLKWKEQDYVELDQEKSEKKILEKIITYHDYQQMKKKKGKEIHTVQK
jgi:hypothetical protein